MNDMEDEIKTLKRIILALCIVLIVVCFATGHQLIENMRALNQCSGVTR